jgi:hypothetical protein
MAPGLSRAILPGLSLAHRRIAVLIVKTIFRNNDEEKNFIELTNPRQLLIATELFV